MFTISFILSQTGLYFTLLTAKQFEMQSLFCLVVFHAQPEYRDLKII